MTNLKKEMIGFYKVYRTTGMIEDDIKVIRKINNLISKYLNTNNERYKFEAINILKTTANLVRFEPAFVTIIKQRIILKEYRDTFERFIENGAIS